MNQRHLYILVTLLCAIGGGLFLYKHFILGFPLSPETTEQTWQYEVRIRFDGTGEAAKISLHIPTGNRSLAVLGEDFFSGRFGLGTARDTDGNRVALWTIRTAKGRQTLFYRATLQRQANRESATTTAPSSPPAVQAPDFSDSEAKAAQALMDQVRARSADATTLVTQLLTLLAKPGPETALLIKPRDTDETRLDMAARLLALAGLPARVAHGIDLSSQNAQPKIHAWLEVFMGRSWQLFDLATQQRVSRSQVLVIWRGAGGIASLRGGERLDTRVTLTPGSELATRMLYRQAGSAGHWLLGFSLLGLPLETQQVYRVLLTVPLGVLVLVLLRNLVGIKTFGTFMPVLVALAFRQTELLPGIVLFSLIVALGLSVRFYLEQLRLLLVPRLASVLIIVVLLMAAISVVANKMGLPTGLSVALFPMVILTMTIERMSIVWEERGPRDAIQQGVGSLVAASAAYLVMSNALLSHLVFNFPELLLLALAATLLLGRYTGYRLLELRRFRVLGGGDT